MRNSILSIFFLITFLIQDGFAAGLVGLVNPADYTWQLRIFDTENGRTQLVGEPITGFGVAICKGSVIDSINDIYFLGTGEGTLIGIDIGTGKKVRDHPKSLFGMEYDPTSEKIIGLVNPADYTWQLGEVNLNTGVVSTIGPAFSGYLLLCISTAFDVTNGKYYLLMTNEIDNEQYIIEIDRTSGEITSLFPTGPFYGIEYDPSTEKLLGLINTASATWQFSHLDLTSGQITELGPPLTGFGLPIGPQGGSALDYVSGYYYIATSDGMKKIDTTTGMLATTSVQSPGYSVQFSAIDRLGNFQFSLGARVDSSQLTGVKVNGPVKIVGGNSATFTATAIWSDGQHSIIVSKWSENSPYATISSKGLLQTLPVPFKHKVTVRAEFTYGEVTHSGTLDTMIFNVAIPAWLNLLL